MVIVNIVSWNVNGLRAVMKKNFMAVMAELNPDIIGLQEIKMRPEQADFTFPGYYVYWNSAERAGYSGTLVLTKQKPHAVTKGFNGNDQEGRIITLDYGDYYVVNVYTPNASEGLKRLDYRLEHERSMRQYLLGLDAKKPVIFIGDMNVAHHPIDLKNPERNRNNAGFTDDEREAFTKLLNQGFVDVFRSYNPEEIQYSWWSYRYGARKRNAGWRLDYTVVSERLLPRVKDVSIHDDILGSDHCPVSITLDFS